MHSSSTASNSGSLLGLPIERDLLIVWFSCPGSDMLLWLYSSACIFLG